MWQDNAEALALVEGRMGVISVLNGQSSASHLPPLVTRLDHRRAAFYTGIPHF
jgi:hypothetical protein